MKLALAQLNPQVGDISYNLEKAIVAAEAAFEKKVDLLVFPELFLAGYPARDILVKPTFIKQIEKAVETLTEKSKAWKGLGFIIGAPIEVRKNNQCQLFNMALFITEGKCLLRQAKTLLPRYDVFDDTRYFSPADSQTLVSFKGEKLGIVICEDLWVDESVDPWTRYTQNPLQTCVEKGATMIVSISASPFYKGKLAYRQAVLKKKVLQYKVPMIYLNQVGGIDELVFDGASFVLNQEGKVLLQSPSFSEGINIVDMKSIAVFEPREMVEESDLFRALVLGTKDYVLKSGFKKVVIGLSGGIDSALVAVIACAALGPEHVTAYTMPSQFSSKGSVIDSITLSKALGFKIAAIPIQKSVEQVEHELTPFWDHDNRDHTEENIQARMRGLFLMALSNKNNALLLATSNKSELAIGYSTLYGDMCGALSVIGDLYKSDVYDLAAWINKEQIIIPQSTIDKEPSAELRPNQKDQDTLPSYDVLDKIVYLYIEKNLSFKDIVSEGLPPKWVEWGIRTIHQNEYKRKQYAPILKVSQKSFGFGRRMMMNTVVSELGL